MSEPTARNPARSYRRRILIGSLLSFILLCSIPIYTEFFSPQKRLWRELAAYKLSIDRGDPRPDFVPHLTSNSVPHLLVWLKSKDYPDSWKYSLARVLRPLSPSLASKLLSLDSSIHHYPPALSLVGFDFVGSQASAALPSLRELALRSDTYDEATMAMIAIGPNAFPIAVEFAQHPQPRVRRTGALLLGAIRANSVESQTILKKMLDDPDEGTRSEAYQALAEFPSERAESVLISKLGSADHAGLFNVAYALHSASTNAMLHLLTIARDSTNPPARIAALGALAFRDDLQRIKSLKEPRSSIYPKMRLVFNHLALNMGVLISANPPDKLHYDRIRSNILSTGLPRVQETLGPAKPPVTSPLP